MDGLTTGLNFDEFKEALTRTALKGQKYFNLIQANF
jgi:hypothetical protein